MTDNTNTAATSGDAPTAERGVMTIRVEHNPADPTGFVRGTVLGYPGSPARLLVVGEDSKHLHTFTEEGGYYGIFKAPANLGCLIVRQRAEVSAATKPAAPVQDDGLNIKVNALYGPRPSPYSAPSPQIADIAELPDALLLRAMRPALDEADGGYVCDTAPALVIKAARDAIAASRRAAGGEVYGYHYEWASCITTEGPQHFRWKFDREAPPEWAVEEGQARNVTPLCKIATPAPASAGQAGQVACRHCDGHGSYPHKGSIVDCRVCGGAGEIAPTERAAAPAEQPSAQVKS